MPDEQEVERLLYVATTRARHALVVVLDQEIFSTMAKANCREQRNFDGCFATKILIPANSINTAARSMKSSNLPRP